MLRIPSSQVSARTKFGIVSAAKNHTAVSKPIHAQLTPDSLHTSHRNTSATPAETFIKTATRNALRIRKLYALDDPQLATKRNVGNSRPDLKACENLLKEVQAQTHDIFFFDPSLEFIHKTLGTHSGVTPLSVPKPITKEVQALAFDHLHSLAKTFTTTSYRNTLLTFGMLRKFLHPDSGILPAQRKRLARTLLSRDFDKPIDTKSRAMFYYIRELSKNALRSKPHIKSVARSLEKAFHSDSPIEHRDKAELAWVALETSRKDATFAPVHDVALAHILTRTQQLHKTQGVKFYELLNSTSVDRALAYDSPLTLEQRKKFVSLWVSHPKANTRSPEGSSIIKPLANFVDKAIALYSRGNDIDHTNATLAAFILGKMPRSDLKLVKLLNRAPEIFRVDFSND